MKSAHRLLPAVALALLSTSTLAATITHTSMAGFLSNLAPGAYTETFDGMPNPPVGPVAFTSGGFSYSASAPSDIYLAGGFLGVSADPDALTINFTSGNVRAVGADFFATDFADNPISILITITLGDGTVESFTPTSFGDTYRGFTSDAAITSLVVSAPGSQYFAGLDNLTVGQVPEPAGWSLAALALAGLIASRRRAA